MLNVLRRVLKNAKEWQAMKPSYVVKIECYDYEDELKAKRLIHADDAFSLIYNIELDIRQFVSFGDGDYGKMLDLLREKIYDSGLLDIYN